MPALISATLRLCGKKMSADSPLSSGRHLENQNGFTNSILRHKMEFYYPFFLGESFVLTLHD